MNKVQKLLIAILCLLLTALPFHTFATIWLAHEFGHLYVWSAWKEVLIVASASLAIYILATNPKLGKKLLQARYNKLAGIFVVLLTLYLAIGSHDRAAVVSFVFHSRYLAVFFITQVAVSYNSSIIKTWEKIIIISGVASAVLAIAQILFFAPEFLARFGYDPKGTNTPGIPPAIHEVAPGTSVYRAQALMRGPNVLGAYLLIPTLVLIQRIRFKKSLVQVLQLGLLGWALYLSYSRSAWLGLALAGAIIGFNFINKLNTKLVAAVGVTIAIATAIITPIIWGSSYVKNVVLHQNEAVSGIQSNEGHLNLSVQATKDVVQNPLGGGLGSAGPASALSKETKIAENYFLQVGQELGWLGLITIVAFHATVGVALWRKHKSVPQVWPIFLVFIALTLTNLLLHTWIDEPVAMTFWALAGGYLALKRGTK